MVRIRMKSMGRRHRPFYRICAMDSRVPRDGRSLENLGYYDPMVRDSDARTYIDVNRARYWLSVGAQPTEKVAVLLRQKGIQKPGPGESWALPESELPEKPVNHAQVKKTNEPIMYKPLNQATPAAAPTPTSSDSEQTETTPSTNEATAQTETPTPTDEKATEDKSEAQGS